MSKLKISYIDFILVIVTFVWGSNPMSMKFGLEYMSPLVYTALQMVMASIVSIILLKHSKTYRKFDKKDLRSVISIGFLGFFMFQTLFVFGVDMTTSGNSAIIIATLPANVVLINKIFKLENITKSMVIGVILSILGVITITLGSNKEMTLSGSNIIGCLLIFLGEIAYAYYTVFSKFLLDKYSNYQVTSFIIIISSIFFLIIAFKDIMLTNWTKVPTQGWLSVSYSGILAMCITNFLWVWALGKIGSTKTSLYNNLTPIFGVVLGCIFLGETFGIVQLLGAVIVFLGLQLTKGKQKLEKN